MRKTSMTIACCLLLAAAVSAPAATEVTGVTNTASWLASYLPNGGIAQGGMATISGTDLGPDPYVQVNSFPLLPALAGVSARIKIQGTTIDTIPVVVWSKQVSVIVPSATPLGDGTITVTYQGQTSAPFPIKIVAHAFGIFALNQGGSGPGIFTSASYVVNTLSASAKPGAAWIIWGTGLGAVSGDETAGALPGDMTNLDVKVYVGGQQAKVIYRGRSGCCAGIGQIVFYVPETVSGCYVPVVVSVNGVPSNTVTMSVAGNGGTCSDTTGLSTQEITAAQSAQGLRIGTVNLNRSEMKMTLPPPMSSLDYKTDTGNAGFSRFDFNGLIRSKWFGAISSYGSCVVYQFQGKQGNDVDPIKPKHLDAGPQINVTGPLGPKQLPRQSTGVYNAQLGGGNSALPGGGALPYLEPGVYNVDNGAGGADVGPFQASITIPQTLGWTNRDAIDTVTRSAGVTVTWTGGDQANGTVVITGISIGANQQGGAGFFCHERVAAGSFKVPAVVLQALPPSATAEGIPMGFLSVGNTSAPVTFPATGLDKGWLTYSMTSSRSVGYE